MVTTLTLERVNSVKSAALKKVLMEQLEYRKQKNDVNRTSYWDTHNDGSHSKHNQCLCVVGGV